MALWLELREALRQPEYVHVLVNPMPVYGLAIGVLSFVIAWVARKRAARGLAYALIFLAGMSAWPAAHFGEAGYDRVYSMSGTQAQKWLIWHRHLAERAVWACYGAAAISAAALVSLWKGLKIHRLAACLSLASALLALGLSCLAAFAGGRIRHSEFRNGPPPAWADTSPEPD